MDPQQKSKEQVQQQFQVYEKLITQDGALEIRHYLQHDEFEIAFEILCLELLQLAPTVCVDWQALHKLSEKLGIEDEAVYDTELHSKLEFRMLSTK